MSDEVVQAEARLVDEWIRPTVGADVEVRIGGVGGPAPGGARAIVLTLLDVSPSRAPRRSDGPAPVQLRARYLVTIAGSASTDGHQTLADLAFNAGRLTGIELEPAAPSPALWRALSVSARPALIASVLLQRERGGRAAPRVRQPLVTTWSPSRPVAGVVVGPGGTPIAGARVEVEGQPQTTYSNHRGEFGFRSVPGTEPAPTLVVHAKGTHLRVRLDPKSSPDDRLLIQVPFSEP